MLIFKRKLSVPPGGKYFYYVAETKTFFESRVSKDDVVQQVTQHYTANQLSIPEDLSARVEDYICRNVADGFCWGDDEGRPKSLARNLTFWNVLKTSRESLVGSSFIDGAVAESRANRCLSCQYNMRHLCLTCTGMTSVVRGLVGGRSVKAQDYLGVCALTGMVILVMVLRQFKLGKLEAPTPPGCWLPNEESQNVA